MRIAAQARAIMKVPMRCALVALLAASAAGDGAKAKQYAAKVNALTKDADSSRPEVQELKTLTTAAAAPVR